MIEFTDDTRAFSVTETAEILDLDPLTVRKYLKEERLHGDKYKGRVYIHEEEIERFKKERNCR